MVDCLERIELQACFSGYVVPALLSPLEHDQMDSCGIKTYEI